MYIDLNGDNDFIDAGEMFSSSNWSAPSGSSGAGSLTSRTFSIPCNITPRATRLRLRSDMSWYGNFTQGQGCQTGSCNDYSHYYGETDDYSINLVLPTSISASFIAPPTAFVKTVVNFINNNPKGYTEHAWDANNDGSYEQRSVTPDFKYTWNTTGSKCVKLRSTNCLGRDSVVNCLNVIAPTAIPVADFIASKTNIEQYDIISISDLSTNGPWKWKWNVYDSVTYKNDGTNGPVASIASGAVISNPNSNGRDENTQNPEFSFDLPGCYVIELTSTNDIGPSVTKRKVCYINVTTPTKYILGFGTYGPNADNIVGSNSGTIFDNGGDKLNYGNNQGLGTRSFLQITPCNALKINLTLTQIRLKDAGDVLRIWDGKGASGTLLGRYSVGDKGPKKLTATSGSMYILFESDAVGVDSGFAGFYNSELGSPTPPSPNFSQSTKPGYNSTPIFLTNTTANISGVPTWEWTVDGSSVFGGTKKDLKTTFYTDGKYEVCLEVKSCVGNKKYCDTVEIVTASSVGKVDFVASNRRPTVGVNTTVLKPLVENANRFTWSIFPTTYTIVNSPSAPSVVGSGFVTYNSTPGDSFPTPILKFTAAGCYTITLKAWNSLNPTSTTKTVVKNKYICALDYCTPTSYLLSSDVGINRVRVLDGSTELINNYTTSGDAAYTDYSTEKQASVTFGKTYNVEISRNSAVDPANRTVYIDWNIDGDFNDADEQITTLTESTASTLSFTGAFTVPFLSKSFEGLTRMRVVANYNNNAISPCGPITAGEYEDYGLLLMNDRRPPTITLNGSDTVRIEKCGAYTDAGAVAMDASEGNISSRLVATSDLDSCTAGIYTIEYNVTDASGNDAIPVRRTIIVVLDKTPPTLTLSPTAPGCIQATRTTPAYIEPGYSAANTNPFLDLTTSVIVTGNVNTKVPGIYVLTYSVKDVAGNETVKTRTVCVEDTKAPTINQNGTTNVQINSVWIDQTSASDELDNTPTLTRTWDNTNGPLNTLVRATYTATYTAEDDYSNVSAPVVRAYRVDDFIPPVISLNTFDIVYHEVRTAYNSIPASVSDNYYDNTQVSITKTAGNVNPNVLGTYSETFEAVDGSGNKTTKTRTVVVQDTKAPSVWGEVIHGCVGEKIWPWWGLSTQDNYYSPAQLKPLIEIIRQNVDETNEGLYSITYRVTDPSGNTSNEFTRMVVYTYWPKCTNSTVDVKDIDINNTVTVYPNPSNGLVTIDLKGNLAQNANIEVYNAMGQLVFNKTYTEVAGKYNVDLTNEATGVYTVKLIANGATVTKRVVITK
jgi:PKD repeat protein